MTHIFDDTKVAFESKSDKELESAHFLFRVMSNSMTTKFGSLFFKIPSATKIPFVKSGIKKTIYKHFVGGETPQEALLAAKEMYKYGVSSILDYSVEGQEKEEDFDRVKDEILSQVDIAKSNEEIPCVVFKPTALGKKELYAKVTRGQELSSEEEKSWNNVKKRYDEICKKCHDNEILVMVDAEDYCMQKAADDLVDELMATYNKERCIVMGTLQMYRHDRLDYLKESYEKAERENYFIGYKIVRGAYMEKERERAQQEGYPSPIQPNKEATDRDYNLALKFMVENISRISLYAGTHNEQSSKYLIQLLKENNIEKNNPQIWFGQLYGMGDHISFKLGYLGYNIAKYLPYGPIEEVMPYLIRRAEENTSVAGQSGRELVLIEKEIKRRKLEKANISGG